MANKPRAVPLTSPQVDEAGIPKRRKLSDHRVTLGRVQLYIEPRDAWIGVYIAPRATFVCPLPFVVLRWDRHRHDPIECACELTAADAPATPSPKRGRDTLTRDESRDRAESLANGCQICGHRGGELAEHQVTDPRMPRIVCVDTKACGSRFAGPEGGAHQPMSSSEQGTNRRRDLQQALIAAEHLHDHACTIGCELASGGECNVGGLTDADHAAAARLLHALEQAGGATRSRTTAVTGEVRG
jgi:hypothetical protein